VQGFVVRVYGSITTTRKSPFAISGDQLNEPGELVSMVTCLCVGETGLDVPDFVSPIFHAEVCPNQPSVEHWARIAPWVAVDAIHERGPVAVFQVYHGASIVDLTDSSSKRQVIPDLKHTGPNAKLRVDGTRLAANILRACMIVQPIALSRGSVEWLMFDGDGREGGIATVRE
jgi:hypothetical protein